ncbi:hypothetical protein ACROYT_G028408 [Oculina patagonica]
MDVFRVYTRLMLVALVVSGALQLSESFTWTKTPKNPTVVVEGVNSKRVTLIWDFSASTSNYSVTIRRQRPGESQETQIAYRPQNTAFNYTDQSFKKKYEASLPATLVLKDVKRNDEYVYTIRMLSVKGKHLLTDQVTIDVVVPPNITVAPEREPQLNIGQNFTLKCNAASDPHPKLTWTKDGVPVNQFNVPGYLLQLVNVQRKDAGSYRCTASNGYGEDATSVSIVGIECNSFDCEAKKVGIRLQSEDWKSAYSNQSSPDYRTLKSKLLSAIWSVYTKNPDKQLYRVDVDNFRSGSVVATVELLFGKSATNPLKPLQDEINGKLGPFTVDQELVLNPTILPPTSSNTSTYTMFHSTTTASTSISTVLHSRSTAGTSIATVKIVTRTLDYYVRENRNSRGAVNVCDDEGKHYISDREIPLQVTTSATNAFDNLMLTADASAATLHSPQPGDSFSGKNQVNLDEEYMSLNPATKCQNWEMSREHVHVVKMIGKGAFSQVAKAMAENVNGVKGLTIVAVKMLKENAPDSDRKDLLSELQLMKKLKPHPHVIKLMGCVTETDPLLVLIEYIPYGDLLGYLRKSRGLKDTYFKDPDVKPQTNLTSQQLMRFCQQIADGMSYLCSSKIIHRDLAARNVLVGEGEKCKVTDFGMARNVYQDDIYTKESRGRLPVKWTAYEGLLYGTYTTQSDVWSFGVVLYEIFTVGGSPYPGINPRVIANKLQKGYRMPKPKHVDDQLYQIMLQCWQENPNDRPTFSKLKDTITRMAQSNNETYVNMKEYDTNLYANVDDLSME